MLNIKDYILNKINESKLDSSGINLYQFFGSLSGYKIYNITGGDVCYENLKHAFQSLEINNEMYKLDTDTYNIKYITLKDAAMPDEYNKFNLPKSFIIEGDDFTICKLQPRSKALDPFMILLLPKDKKVLLLPSIDEQGGEPRDWVLNPDTLFDEQAGAGAELIGMYSDDEIYDLKQDVKKYLNKPIKNVTDVFVTLDTWYDNHAK